MGVEVNPAVWGLLGTLVGAAASVGTTWLASAHTARLESQRARDARAEVARTFQRQTLLELQEALNVLARKAMQSYIFDLSQYRLGNGWGSEPSPDDLANSLMEAFRTVGMLTQRVSSETLRLAIAAFTETLALSVNASSYDLASNLRSRVPDEFAALSVSLGDCLRSHYETV